MVLRKRSKLLPWRIAYWAALALVGIVILLDRRPIHLEAGDAHDINDPPGRIEATTDVLVLLSDSLLQTAHEHGGSDRSWLWVHLLQREVGPVAAIDVAAFHPNDLAERRFVVVTRSASQDRRLDEHAGLLDAFVERGGTLVLEQPEGSLRERWAADGGGGWRIPGAITLAEGAGEELAEALQQLPLMTRFRGSTRPAAGSRTLMAMDGAPVVLTHSLELGTVLVVDFDLGTQLHALFQGLPGPDGSVRPRQQGRPIHTADLVASPQLLGATEPWGDFLSRFVVHSLLGHDTPIFSLWPWPDGRPGALVSSHVAHVTAGRPLWQSIHERQFNARTVTFLPASTEDTLRMPASDQEHAGHAALLWAVDAREASLFRSFRIFGRTVARRPLTLDAQLELLRTQLGSAADIRGVRTIDGRWTSDPVLPWTIMQTAGLHYSVSYGPLPEGQQGFLFGSCHPFVPLDSAGRPLRIREFPVCFLDPRTEEDRERLVDALRASTSEPRTIHLLTRSDRFRESPSMDAFDAWRDALRLAERERLWIGGAGELIRFDRQRRNAELRVSRIDVEQRFADGAPRTIVYQIEVATDVRGLHLQIPRGYGRFELDSVRRGATAGHGSAMADRVQTQTAQYAGREVRLVALNPGFTTLTVRYSRRP